MTSAKSPRGKATSRKHVTFMSKASRYEKFFGQPAGIAHALSGLADVELEEGNHEAARLLLSRMIEIARETGSAETLAVSLADHAEVERRQGELPHALDVFREALTAAQEIGNLYLTQLCLDGIARVLGALGEPVQAARLWGASEAIREQGGFVLWHRRHYDEAVNATRTQASEHDFDRAWDAGRLLNTQQAVAAGRRSQ
jgi:tetratricopeptide (TPR) repeat protein